MTTYADLLAARLRREPGQPLVTFYDESTGERVELSTTTYANWVAKVAGLLVDELDAERGMSLRLDLPTHWLGPVLLGAAWSVGLVVVDAEDPDIVVCGPDTLADWAPRVPGVAVLAAALTPLGRRFAEPVPPGVLDLGIEVWSQPDGFVSLDPPGDQDAALDWAGQRLTQGELWAAAVSPATAAGDGGGDRLLSETNPASPPGLASFAEPLAGGGSVVLVAHAGAERLEAIAVAERVTRRFLPFP